MIRAIREPLDPEAFMVERMLRGETVADGLGSDARNEAAIGFLEALHRPEAGDAKHGIVVSVRNPWRDWGTIRADEVRTGFQSVAYDLALDGYATVNGYLVKGKPHNLRGVNLFPPARRGRLMTRVCAQFLDLDPAKDGALDNYTARAMVDRYAAEVLQLPVSMWVFSHGLRPLWLVRRDDADAPLHAHDSTINRWQARQAALCELFAKLDPGLGVDGLGTITTTATIRPPGTVNSKDGKRVSWSGNFGDDGRILSYTESELDEPLVRLGVIPERKRRAFVSFAPRYANPGWEGTATLALLNLRRVESVLKKRKPGSIPKGRRAKATVTYAHALRLGCLGACTILNLDFSGKDTIRNLYSARSLQGLANLGPADRAARVVKFARLHCEPGPETDFEPWRDGRAAALAAENLGPTARIQHRILCRALGVTAPEATACRFGREPWPVVGADARSPREAAMDSRRSAIRAIVETEGGVPSVRSLQNLLKTKLGRSPGMKAVLADLKALGLS